MIPRFTLIRPSTLVDAFAAFERCGGDAAWLAGGTELLQVMKMGLAQIGTLIDIKAVPELHGLDRRPDGSLRIGAGTTHRTIERSAIVREQIPGLAALEADVANVRVRNTGTIGGNLAFAEPHSDPATFLLACGASVELVSPRGRRELGIADFILGPLWTAREQDELVLAVHIPHPAPGMGRAYEKLAFFERPAASVGVRLAIQDGLIADATVAVGSLTEVPMVVATAGAALVGVTAHRGALDDGIRSAIEGFSDLDVVADHNGSADYKRHLAGVLLGRAAQRALTEGLAHA